MACVVFLESVSFVRSQSMGVYNAYPALIIDVATDGIWMYPHKNSACDDIVLTSYCNMMLFRIVHTGLLLDVAVSFSPVDELMTKGAARMTRI